jgi:hypothetical protein
MKSRSLLGLRTGGDGRWECGLGAIGFLLIFIFIHGAGERGERRIPKAAMHTALHTS